MGGLDGLLDKLRNGTFGEVIDRLQLALREERVDDHLCPLPKVVVVGSEGVGKSSLLENLTKLQLFPTGEGLKTTCPVVLDLYPARADGDPEYTVSKVGASLFPTKNVEEAMGHVQMYMPCGIIAATPVNVTVTAKRLTRLALVDVPGLRTHGSLHEPSRELIESFLKDQNTLIINVCEATTAAVVCDTLGLIDRYHCRDRTIMVFTKADGMALASQWHKLFSKLLGSEPGRTPEEGLQDLDCVAVINSDSQSLAAALGNLSLGSSDHAAAVAENEARKFAAELQRQNYDAGNAAKIQERCGIDKLAAKLHTRFLDFVGHQWKDSTLARLRDRKQQAHQKLQALGALPEQLSLEEVVQHVSQKVEWDHVLDAVVRLAVDQGRTSIFEDGSIDLSVLEDAEPTRINLLRGSKRMMLAFELQSAAIKRGAFTAWTHDWDEHWAAVIQAAQLQLKMAFWMPRKPVAEDSKLNLERFHGVQQALCSRVEEYLKAQALGQLCRRLPESILSLATRRWRGRQGQPLDKDDILHMVQAVQGAFLQILSEEVVSALDSVFAAPLAMELKECEEAATHRAQLNAQITQLDSAIALIQQIVSV